MSTPKRIQLSRAKGWRKPPGAVTVSRPSKWGNPVSLGTRNTRKFVVDTYRNMLVKGYLTITVDDVKRELRGKDLCCWCPLGQPCHADVLLEIANV